MTSRRDRAEELAQEIFIRCYRAAPSYQASAKFSTWIFLIARNTCLKKG
jgi:RNA polymerase sigma-70 factor (ECF subfamily)